MKSYWMPLGCLRVGLCEGTVPPPDGEMSGGGGCYSCDPLKRNEGAPGVSASLDNKHSCTRHFCTFSVLWQACDLSY